MNLIGIVVHAVMSLHLHPRTHGMNPGLEGASTPAESEKPCKPVENVTCDIRGRLARPQPNYDSDPEHLVRDLAATIQIGVKKALRVQSDKRKIRAGFVGLWPLLLHPITAQITNLKKLTRHRHPLI